MSETTRCANCAAEVPVDKPHQVGECHGPPLTLTDFLLARIAEDERAARSAEGNGALAVFATGGRKRHMDRWHPARVLAECEAKRRIVEECREAVEDGSDDEGPLTSDARLGLHTMRHLASVYADRTGYDPGWAL